MQPLPQQILELAYWLPLIALFLVSLGIVGLKRKPSLPLLAERLKTRPFYLIAFPVVTLVVGIELFLFVVHVLYAWFFSVGASHWFQAIVALLLGIPQIWPRETFVVLASGFMVCAALAGSGHVLRCAFRQERREGIIANQSRPWIKGVVLAVALFWTWLSLRYVIVHFESTRFTHLRIVWTTERDMAASGIDEPN